MPASPDLGATTAALVLRVYTDAETTLLAMIAARLAKGLDGAGWEENKLAEVRALRADAQRAVDRLNVTGLAAVRQAITDAYAAGVKAAMRELRDLGMRLGVLPTPALPVSVGAAFGVGTNTAAVEALTRAAMDAVHGTHTQITREVVDIYQRVTTVTAAQTVTGVLTRRQAAQRALDTYAQHGITGFTDKAGRNWSLPSYVEMATRTMAGQAAVQGHVDTLAAHGHALVIVSDAPQECSLCFLPGTVVEGPVPTWRSRLEYTGDVVTIRTASGKNLTGTPDHPVLTTLGWRALKTLNPGDQVISDNGQQRDAGVVPDHVQVPALIEEAGEAVAPLLLAGPSRRDLNEGTSYREVRTVWPDRDLLGEGDATFGEPLRQERLVGAVRTGAALPTRGDGLAAGHGHRNTPDRIMGSSSHLSPLLGSSCSPAALHRRSAFGGENLGVHRSDGGLQCMVAGSGLNASTAQVVRYDSGAEPVRGAKGLSAFPRDVAGHELVGLRDGEAGPDTPRADGHAPRGEGIYEALVADMEGGHELLTRLAGQVAADEIVEVGVGQYTGHVWDLTTEPSWFFANGIVAHNCRPWEGKVLAIRADGLGTHTAISPVTGLRVQVTVRATLAQAIAAGFQHPACRHSVAAYQLGVTKPITDTADPAGDKARQHQRYLERRIRAAKREQAVALDPTATQIAGKRIRARQAALRAHIAEHDLRRLPYREQVTRAI